MCVAASASLHQFFGCTSFGWIDKQSFMAATAGNEARQQGLTPSLVRQPSSSVLENSHITGASGDFQGLPNICLTFKHIFTYQSSCADHLIQTKDLCWPVWNALLSPQLWNTAFWSRKSCKSPSHPIRKDRMSNNLLQQQWWLPCQAAQAGMPCTGPAWEGGGASCSCQERMGVCNLPGFIFVFLTETALLV